MSTAIKHWIRNKNVLRVLRIIGLIIFLAIVFLVGNVAAMLLPRNGWRSLLPSSRQWEIQSQIRDSGNETKGGFVAGIKVPDINGSADEKMKFAQAIHTAAKETNTLEIKSDCTIIPPIIRVKEGSDITIWNRDSREHHMVIFTGESTIASGARQMIKAQFKNGPGIYGVMCDGNATAGFLEVAPGE